MSHTINFVLSLLTPLQCLTQLCMVIICGRKGNFFKHEDGIKAAICIGSIIQTSTSFSPRTSKKDERLKTLAYIRIFLHTGNTILEIFFSTL